MLRLNRSDISIKQGVQRAGAPQLDELFTSLPALPRPLLASKGGPLPEPILALICVEMGVGGDIKRGFPGRNFLLPGILLTAKERGWR